MQPNSQQAFQQYQTFQKGRLKPEDYVKRYSADLGVEDAKARVKSARTAIRATEDTIAATPDSVSGRTSGSLVTDAQRNRLVQNEVAPMQDILRTQNSGYADATGDMTTLNSDLNTKVGLALQGDDTQGNSLLTLYQAATDYEKQQEAIRQYNATLAEQQRQFNEQQKAAKAAAASSGYSPSFGGGGTAAAGSAAAAGKSTDAVLQAAYNDVASRMGQSDAAIKSDYNATLKSANRGNAKDKMKIEAYHKLRPDLFGGKGVVSASAVGNGGQLRF